MKNLLVILFLNFAFISNAQYVQVWTNASTGSIGALDESLTDGLCTKFNYSSSLPTNYYNVACGFSDAKIASDTSDNLRFVLLNKAGSTATTNVALRLKDKSVSQPKWFNSKAYGICEINRTNKNGGFITVGSVSDNTFTNAQTGSNFDAFFTKISKSGSASSSFRYDFAGGNDVFTSIINSAIDTNLFYTCGYSDGRLLVLSLNTDGSVNWHKACDFSTNLNYTPNVKGFGLCELTDGSIVVVGQIGTNQSPAPNYNDGFAIRITPTGTVLWMKKYDLGADECFRNVIFSASLNQIVVAGYSINSYSTPAEKTWIHFLDLSGNSLLARLNVYQAPTSPGSYTNSKGFDLREYNNNFYITGPAYRNSITKAVGLLKTNATGDGIWNAFYNDKPIDDYFGIDLALPTQTNSGIRIFSNTNEATPLSTIDYGYILKTDFNGKTCFAADSSKPLIIIPTVIDSNLIEFTCQTKTVKKLTALKLSYNNGLICFGGAITPAKNSDEANLLGSIQIYPNPASEVITIQFEDGITNDIEIELIDSQGRAIFKNKNSKLVDESLSLNIADYKPGFYIIKINAEGNIYSSKFIKQ